MAKFSLARNLIHLKISMFIHAKSKLSHPFDKSHETNLLSSSQHRTGCIIAAYRLLRNWTLAATLTEYRHFAGAKYRPLDEKFISGFDVRETISVLSPRLLEEEGVDLGSGRGRVPYPTPPCSDKDGAVG